MQPESWDIYSLPVSNRTSNLLPDFQTVEVICLPLFFLSISVASVSVKTLQAYVAKCHYFSEYCVLFYGMVCGHLFCGIWQREPSSPFFFCFHMRKCPGENALQAVWGALV